MSQAPSRDMTTSDVAKRLGVGTRRVRQLKDELGHRRVGFLLVFDSQAVEDFANRYGYNPKESREKE